MKRREFIREATAGGPGLDGYAYQGDTYCIECGELLIFDLGANVIAEIWGTDDPLFCDSDTVPQPIFFGESDSGTYCAQCGDLLYGPEEVIDDEQEREEER